MFFCFLATSVYAQDTVLTNQNNHSQSLIIQKDSAQDHATQNDESQSQALTKSPLGAVWRSLVFPGWGQIYVENYWKAPIFVAGIGVSIYFIIWNNQKFKYYQSRYDELIVTDPNNSYELERLKSQKEFYRDNRDKSYFLLGLTYILAAVDAYVGAHLFDFNVDDNLQMRLMPYYYNQFGINFSLKIK